MPAISKQEADAYDKMLDAADNLAELIESSGIEMDEYVLEELTIFLAKRAPKLRTILKGLKYNWP